MKTIGKALTACSHFLFRFGLAIILIWLGYLKFKNDDSDFLKNFLTNSDAYHWLLTYITSHSLVLILASLQIILGILIATNNYAPKLAFWAGLITVVFFMLSISTTLTSDAIWLKGSSFPDLSTVGQSALKDLLLLAAAAWSTGDSA